MPRIVNHDERRREIVLAARRVIGSGGLERATVREIAREAGCSSGTLAHYFTNREDILASCLVMSHRGVRARTDSLLGAARGLRALRILLIEALPLNEEQLLEAKIEVCFWGAAVLNDRMRSIQNEEVDVFHSRIRHLIVQAREEGELGPTTDIDLAVEECRMLIDALSVKAVMQLNPTDPDRTIAHVDVLLRRLRTDTAAGSE